MKKALLWTTIGLLLLVFAPVLVRQLQHPEPRTLQGESLDPARFREIHFRNEEQGLDLAGLLFLPSVPGPYPAAVVIHGSGTSARANRWYLSLAHDLQDRGIAVLLPDKRGSEQSGGDWHSASFDDLATDTLAAIDYLGDRDDLLLSGIGVIGMSQGGWISTLVADRRPDLDFVVSVVGSAVSTHEQVLFEEVHNLQQLGVLPGVSHALAPPATFVLRRFVQPEFWNAVGDFDPLPYWRRMEVPALALFGAEDTNVPTAESAARLHALDKPNIRVIIYQGSGHALQDPPGQGDRLFRQDALQAIGAFIGESTS